MLGIAELRPIASSKGVVTGGVFSALKKSDCIE